jgi:hypothetical protein
MVSLANPWLAAYGGLIGITASRLSKSTANFKSRRKTLAVSPFSRCLLSATYPHSPLRNVDEDLIERHGAGLGAEVTGNVANMDPRSTPSHEAIIDLVGNNSGPPQTHTQDGSMPPSIEIGSLDPDQAEEEDMNEEVDNNFDDENIESLDDHGRARAAALQLLSSETGKEVIHKNDGITTT